MCRMRGKLFAVCVVIALLVDVVIFLMPGPTAVSHASGLSKSGYSGQADVASTFPGADIHQGRQASLAAAGVYTLKATQIIGTNAHLNSLPDPLHPVLTFTASTLTGMQLTHPMEGVTLTIFSLGQVATTNVAIKTSVFSDLVTALGSFTNKADLLILIAGGTVKTLVMKNVTLRVDVFIHLGTMDAPDFHLVVS